MKGFVTLLAAGCFLYPITNYGSETAHARLYCVSPQFQSATATSAYDGFYWRLSLTTLSSGINGELAPSFLTTSYTHSAYVQLYSELYGMTDQGVIGLNVPSNDGNGDGFPDIFEVSQGINNLTTSGELDTQTFYPSGATFTATWNRAPGSTSGTCSFQVYDPDSSYYSLQFNFTFTVLEYTGPLTYTPGSNTVSAAVSLTQTGNPANTLVGPIIFDKSPTDPFNTLTNRAGVWTNAAMQQIPFYGDLILRDTTEQTNYFSYYYFEFTDNPITDTPDYVYWGLSIDDTNDANANGIPDFSDNPSSVAPPQAPHLSIALGSTNLLLTISGTIGHTNWLQQIGSLGTTNWQTTQTFMLTNSSQVVPMPRPSGSPQFWRVVAW